MNKYDVHIDKEYLRRLSRSLGGYLQGTLGSCYARLYPVKTRRGIKYQQRVSSLPSYYTVNRRKDLESNRNKFKTASLFAKTIYSSPQLLNLWRKNTKKGINLYNHLTQLNYSLSQSGVPSKRNIISPDTTPLEINNLIINPAVISGHLKFSADTKIIAVISFSHPVKDINANFKLVTTTVPITDNNFTIPVTTELSKYSILYKNFTLYIAAVSESNGVITSSGTYTLTAKTFKLIHIKLNSKSAYTKAKTVYPSPLKQYLYIHPSLFHPPPLIAAA
jgi:hypothetical protein